MARIKHFSGYRNPQDNCFVVIEYHGKGDPFFGGSADDRPLGVSGEFLRGAFRWTRDTVATFETPEAALDAARAAPKRDGSLTSVHSWRIDP